MPTGDILECLETFLVVNYWERRGNLRFRGLETRDTAKHPPMHSGQHPPPNNLTKNYPVKLPGGAKIVKLALGLSPFLAFVSSPTPKINVHKNCLGYL